MQKTVTKKPAPAKKQANKPTAVAKSKSTKTSIKRLVAKRQVATEHSTLLAKFNAEMAAQDAFFMYVGAKLKAVREQNIKVVAQYRDLVYASLQSTYEIYLEIQQSEHADDLYNNLRELLKQNNIRINANSTNASVIIRSVFPQFAPKKVYDYGAAILEAERNAVEPADMAQWVKQKTMTALVLEHKQQDVDADSYKDRMQRARVVILRFLESKEITTLASFKTTAHTAEQHMQYDTNTVVMLGTASRRMDRDAWHADFHVNFVLPPSFDIFKFVIDRLARTIQFKVAEWESKMDEVEDRVWGAELSDYLHAAERAEEERAIQRRQAVMEMNRIT